MRIVTAAIDPELQEMHVPLSAAVMGEAAGEADFGARLVDSKGDLDVQGEDTDDDDDDDGEGRDRKETDDVLEGGVGDGYHVPPQLPEIDGLRWDRRKRDTSGGNGAAGGSGGLEKRAWVVCPGMGHIG